MIADFASLVAQKKVWVLDRSDIDGFIVMYPKNDALQVDNVAVDPLLHGQGLGGALLAFAEDEAKRLGITELTLYTNAQMTENLSLYPSLGFREVGRRKEDGLDRVYFSKTLLQQA